MHNFICGSCDRPAGIHPVLPYDEFGESVIPCNREPEAIGYATWDTEGYWTNDHRFVPGQVFQDYCPGDLPAISYEGPGAQEVTREDEWDYMYESSREANLDAWSDRNQSEITYAIDWHYVLPPSTTKPQGLVIHGVYPDHHKPEFVNYKEVSNSPSLKYDFSTLDENTSSTFLKAVQENYPHERTAPVKKVFVTIPHSLQGETFFSRQEEERTAYVEGQAGFIAKRFINDLLVEAHHNKLLNLFTNKRGNLQVGGVELLRSSNTAFPVVTARCVQNTCSVELSVPTTLDATIPEEREQMELFVLGLISHGNNHAAAWFRNRPTFYKLHHPDCTLNNCNPATTYCEERKPSTTTLTVSSESNTNPAPLRVVS